MQCWTNVMAMGGEKCPFRCTCHNNNRIRYIKTAKIYAVILLDTVSKHTLEYHIQSNYLNLNTFLPRCYQSLIKLLISNMPSPFFLMNSKTLRVRSVFLFHIVNKSLKRPKPIMSISTYLAVSPKRHLFLQKMIIQES